jgi:hypothetical protein
VIKAHLLVDATLFRPSQGAVSPRPAKTLSKPLVNHRTFILLQLTRPLLNPQTSHNNSDSDSDILPQRYLNQSILSQWPALETAHMIRTFPLSQQQAELALNPPQAIKERRRYKQ